MHVDTERSIIVNMAIVTKGRITSKSEVYRISTIVSPLSPPPGGDGLFYDYISFDIGTHIDIEH